MSRVGLVVAAVAAGLSFGLAGCSSMPDWMPDWMSSKSPSAQLQDMRFESDPPGADVRTTQGQTCLTPCNLQVASQSQAVTLTKVGFVPQTIQITAGEPPSHAFWESPPPSLSPNPVQVVLQALPPPPEMRRRKPKGTAARTRTAAKTMAPQSGASNPFPDPPPAGEQPDPPAQSPFPPPPSGQ